jgi:hypothetical protein
VADHPRPIRDDDDDRPAHPSGRAALFVLAVTVLIVVLAVISTLQQT